MDAIVNQIKNLASSADDAQRKLILETLRVVSDSIETPQDTMQRLMYLALEPAVIRIGLDLDLFKILVDNEKPVTVSDLASKTGAATTLLARLLRYLASVGVVTETGKDSFASNNITKTLTLPAVVGGVYHNFDTIGPAWQALPDFLKEHKYQKVENVVDTPFQKAWNTDKPGFVWAQTQPEKLARFNQFMAGQRMGMTQWHEVYPIAEKTQDLGPEQVFFVDVGGGIGHQTIALREKFPGLKNRFILQDIPFTIAQAIPHEGVEAVVQDFFQPQGIIGARVYYMRNIIHDYPDEKASLILKNTAAALAPGSVILVDDMVVPNKGAHFHTTQLDLTMMSSLASIERTHEQWYSLVEQAGLKINKIYTYTLSLQDSIIEIVKE